MPRGGARQGSGPKPLSEKGKRAGLHHGGVTLTWDETEALDQAVQEVSPVPLEWGSPEWNKAMRVALIEMGKRAIRALPQYQATQDNTAHMAALNSREQVDE